MTECPNCRSRTVAVWDYYVVRASLRHETGSTRVRLPMRQCVDGHISGWRQEDEYWLDVAETSEPIDLDAFVAGTVPARRGLLRRLCGRCGERLRLRSCHRLRGTARMPVRDLRDSIAFDDLGLPDARCASCGTRPHPHVGAVHGTVADLAHWLWLPLAEAMPEDNATHTEPRRNDP